MNRENTPVLVVGGGLVGLSTALFLTWREVPVILVERHPGSSAHPRAIGYTPRTIELYRSVGLGPSIPEVKGGGTALRRVQAESLAGTWTELPSWTPGGTAPTVEYSPCGSGGLAQDKLEPILRAKAVELGADVRLSTTMVSFEQDDSAVRAVLRGPDGVEYEVVADHLVGADGHRSPVRERLGIGLDGRGLLSVARSVLFRAPGMDDYLARGVGQFVIRQPGFSVFVTTYGDGRWLLLRNEPDDGSDDGIDWQDPDTLVAMVRRAVGESDLDVELVTTGRWEVKATVAQRFSAGRVFLAGDAAHTLPPNRGGYGANTGIEDAHNLAWKLAAVHRGESGPALLDSYDPERRPIALLRHEQIFARTDGHDDAGPRSAMPILDDAAMEFGQLYRSGAVLGAGEDLPPARRPDEWAGQPGTRAPHLWLRRDGERLSTLDLFQRGWVLLALGDGWAGAARRAAEATGVPVECVRVGADLEAESDLGAAYGLSDGGAALVRPDGYLAWRAPTAPEDPAGALTDALSRVAAAPLLLRSAPRG